MDEDKVVPLFRWEVHAFPWGAAVKEQRTGRWSHVCIDGQELNVTNRDVILHENGIEFI